MGRAKGNREGHRTRAPLLDRLVGIAGYSDEVTSKLVAVQYRNRMPTVANAAINLSICLIAFHKTASPAYVAIGVWAVLTTGWRLREFVLFARDRERLSSRHWAIRSVIGSFLVSSVWGFEALLIPSHNEPALTAVLLGTLSALMTAGAVRNCVVPAASYVQLLVCETAQLIGCNLAADAYLHLYSFVIVLMGAAGFNMTNALHQEFLQNLLNEREARDLAAELARANANLALLNEHLKEEVAIDPLTGLLNRRAFDLAAVREWRIATRQGSSVAVLMIDVDHFKRYNDCYGHQAGDECLRIVASVIAAGLQRPADVVARYGGEEFVAVLAGTDQAAATAIGERLVQAMIDRAIVHDASPLGRVSLSVGVAATPQARETTLQALIGSADSALYAAKNAGRNRVRHLHHLTHPSFAGEAA